MVPTQSRERSGEILWMTVSRIPSYARRWPFETGRPASVLTRKAMSPNHKFRELRDQLPVEQRLANPKALTARPRTSRVRRCRCSLQLDRGSQPIGRAIYPFTYRSDWGDPCSSFVRFGASWPVGCCTCSRQQVALFPRSDRKENRVRLQCYFRRTLRLAETVQI